MPVLACCVFATLKQTAVDEEAGRLRLYQHAGASHFLRRA
jgi:hypothetical protein